MDILDSLREPILAHAFGTGAITDGRLCEKLIRERGAAVAEIDRLRTMVEDACKVFEHYDLPEHAFHYRRALNSQ